jgi:predicted nucleic acid-binding protein
VTPLVIDASVVVKLFVPEEFSPEASSVLGDAYELHAPDLLVAEFGNALWKKVQRGSLTPVQASGIADSLAILPVQFHPSAPLLPKAVTIAVGRNVTVYDALYLALAENLRAPFVTADHRLHAALAAAFGGRVMRVIDLAGTPGTS